MTFTKQPRSLPIMDDPDSKSIQPFSFWPVNSGSPEAAEIIDNLVSIHSGLNDLYTKLDKLNSEIIKHKERKKEDNK